VRKGAIVIMKKTRNTSWGDNTTTSTTLNIQSLRCHQEDGRTGTGGGRRGERWGTHLRLILQVLVMSLRDKTLIVVIVVIPVKLGSPAGREDNRRRCVRVRGR
jgi:hypothetical protein